MAEAEDSMSLACFVGVLEVAVLDPGAHDACDDRVAGAADGSCLRPLALRKLAGGRGAVRWLGAAAGAGTP
jgi:hypothetical protein